MFKKEKPSHATVPLRGYGTLCNFIEVYGGLDVLPEPLDEHDVDVRFQQRRADLLQHRVQHLPIGQSFLGT